MRWRQQWRRRRCDRGGDQDGGNADGGDEGVVVRAEGLAGTAGSSSQHDAATRTRPFTVQTAECREVCLANSLLWTALLARANRRVQRYASVNKAGPRRCDGLERSGSECYIDDIYCFSTPIRWHHTFVWKLAGTSLCKRKRLAGLAVCTSHKQTGCSMSPTHT